MTAALLAVVLAAPADVTELLRRVAARYAGLGEFLLEVKETSITAGQTPGDAVRKRLAVASGGRFFLELRTAIRFRIVSDGEMVRSFQVGGKKYVEEELHDAGHEQVQDEVRTLVERYAALERVAGFARLVKMQKVKQPTGAVECAVVEVSMGDSGETGWFETLWIDPGRALVLRSSARNAQFSPLSHYREYTLPPGVEQPGAALFVFTPRDGAKAVSRLPERGNLPLRAPEARRRFQ
ncbi:MAG: hypothetical protein HY858_12130 [Candidatus Solibacter usitatus]|nr:hypothetical protein [Candidatus Solibacter usitatus]